MDYVADAEPKMKQRRIGHNAHRKRITTLTVPQGTNALRLFLIFLLSVLLANALIGERGLFASLAARRANSAFLKETSRLRSENERLRKMIHSLKQSPETVESIAREDLGLISPGEKIFLLQTKADPAEPSASVYGPSQ